MQDQTLISILLGVLAVIGTLVGALGGTILANRHATKLEELRIAQEKAKRDTAIIEEVYTLLTKIYVSIRDNIGHERPCRDGINDNINRVQTLIYLYLPALREKFVSLNKSLAHLSVEVYYAQQAHNPIQVQEIVHEPQEKFDKEMIEIKIELEKLVR